MTLCSTLIYHLNYNSLSFPSHYVSTRSSDSLVLSIPYVRSSLGKKAFSVIGPRLWNSLPPDTRNFVFTTNIPFQVRNTPLQNCLPFLGSFHLPRLSIRILILTILILCPYRMTPSVRYRAIEVHYYFYYYCSPVAPRTHPLVVPHGKLTYLLTYRTSNTYNILEIGKHSTHPLLNYSTSERTLIDTILSKLLECANRPKNLNLTTTSSISSTVPDNAPRLQLPLARHFKRAFQAHMFARSPSEHFQFGTKPTSVSLTQSKLEKTTGV